MVPKGTIGLKGLNYDFDLPGENFVLASYPKRRKTYK